MESALLICHGHHSDPQLAELRIQLLSVYEYMACISIS